ncbi:MAG: gliding motility-associated C-terminal domain-containing protein [Saprospirales bacterium]|nr:MAG: gliding motility-associated C-terminal domain-containing protein [Saprospirales bacterium]
MDNSSFFRLLVLVALLIFPSWMYSYCALGGELRYSCLGNNNFEIELIVYTDCYDTGNPCPFTTPSSRTVRFFTSSNLPASNIGDNGEIVLEKVEEYPLSDTTHQDRECGFIPKTVCVNAIVYTGTVNLPFRFGGYYLAAEWPQRKVMVTNMRQTTPNGPIFTSRISQNALTQCHSGSKFRDWYQLYFCLDEEISYDHSVISTDADSLIYEFYQPFINTWPDPPFNTLRFENGYGLNNLLGNNNDRLRIDKHSGIISGAPSQAGTYLIGVAVREYSNNQLIGTTYREIFFFTGDCGGANADFEIKDFYCINKRVMFSNFNENFITSEWIFGDFDNPIGSTTADNGRFTYPEFGEFDVTRIAYGPFDACNDTVTQTILIKDEEVGLFVEVERGNCDSDTLDVIVTAKSTFLPLDDLDIELIVRRGNTSETTSSTVHEFSISGFPLFTILLSVVNPDICAAQYFELQPTGFIFNDGFTKDYFICDGEVTLDEHCDLRNELIDLVWYPAPLDIIEQDFPFDCIIPVVAPDTSTLYVGTLTLEDCIGHFYYNVGVYKEGDKFLQDTFCGRKIQIEENPFSGFANGYTWRFLQDDILVGSRIAEFPEMVFPSYGDAIVELIPFQLDGINCPDTIRQEIFLFEPSVEWEIDLITLNCIDSLTIVISGNQTGGVLGEEEYIFIKEGQDTIVSQNAEFEFTIGLSDRIEFTLIVKTDKGCFIEESFNLETPYNPNLTGSESFSICFGDTLVLEYPPLDGLEFNWIDTFGFLSGANELPALVMPDSSYLYEISTSFNGCDYSYTFEVEVNYSNEVDLSSLWICDNLFVQELDFKEILGSNITQWNIYDSEGELFKSGKENQNVVVFPELSTYSLELFSDIEGQCGTVGRGVIHFLDTSTVELEIFVKEEECVEDKVFLTLERSFALAGFPEDLFELNWTVITSNDSIFFSDDTLRLRSEGIKEFSVFLKARSSEECVFYQALDFNFELIDLSGAIDSFQICRGDSIQLLTNISGVWDYVWTPAYGFLSPLTDSNPLVSPDQSIQYIADIQSKNCSAEQMVFVEVFAGPNIESIWADPMELFEPGEILLNSSILGDYIDITWRPKELLDNPFVSNPIGFIEETVTFTVVVSDSSGCTDSSTVTVIVEKRPCAPPFVFLPNAFSPNGDGMNDVLYVRGEEIVNIELRIYNRYGQQIFYSDDQSRGWKGDFRGEDMPPGVYSYHLVVECTDGKENELRGNVNLVR